MAFVQHRKMRREPPPNRREPSQRAILITALAGVIAAYVNVSVLALAIGELSSDFDESATTMAWVVVAPMLAFAVLGPTAGKLADLYGRRQLFLIGLAGCGIFAAAAAAATSAMALILFRTLSSVFGTSTAPAGMAMVAAVYPPEQRAKALGYWGLAMAGGPTVGMVAGGALLDYASWRWLFILQIPLVVVAYLIAHHNLPHTPQVSNVRFDVLGTVLLAFTTGGLVFAINRAPSWGWTNPVVIALIALAPLAAWAFIRQENRCPHPLIPMSYFRSRNFWAPMAGLLLISIAYQGGFVVLPLMMREVLDYSNGRISLVSLARPLFYGLAGPLAGYLSVRLGERRAAFSGAVAVAASCFALAIIGPGTSDAYIFGALAIAGAGFGGLFPPMTAAVTTAVADRDLGLAGAASSMMIQIGMVVGIQLHQTVQESREASVGLVNSYHEAFLAGGFVAIIGFLVVSQVQDVNKKNPDPGATIATTRTQAWEATTSSWADRTPPSIRVNSSHIDQFADKDMATQKSAAGPIPADQETPLVEAVLSRTPKPKLDPG
jgi:EmrB/QacA subfamily drug resistance transporter